jgi:hypothetical protein
MQETDSHATVEPMQPSLPTPVIYTKRRAFFTAIFLAPGAGLVASLLAAMLMILLRLTAGLPSPVELFGDFTLKHIDVGTFLRLLMTFSPNSKTVPLGLALLGMIALGTVLSLPYAAVVRVQLPAKGYRPGKREWLTALAFGIVMTLVGVVLFWDELRQNFYGLPINLSRLTSASGLLADFVFYAVVLCLAYRVLLPKYVAPGGTDEVVSRRRLLLSRAGVAALSIGGLAGTTELVRSYLSNYASYDGMKTATHFRVTSPITPNADHYVVTQNPVDPTPNSDLWRLEVTGLIKNAGTYTFAEVQALPSTSRAITLECIANGRGDHLIGTAIWQGVTLRSLLERHGSVQPGARYIAFYSVDGYNISLPLDEVLMADPLLAWRMNGAELPLRHGYPMRVLIPGRYGDQGWYNGPLQTMSRIDHPIDQVSVRQTVEVGGIAFAGNRGIQKVEVSVDGGVTWHRATLQPPLSQDSWVMWAWQWTPTQTGAYTVVCRATDGTGAVQTGRLRSTVPDGATGYHQIPIQVV